MKDVMEGLVFHNWKIKVYAAVVSLSIWIIILGQKSLTVTWTVPVEYILDQNLSVQDAIDKVNVTIEAKRSVLRDISKEQAAPVVDLRGYLPGPKRIKIKKGTISLPLGAKVISVEPKYVTLYVNVLNAKKDGGRGFRESGQNDD